MYLQTFPPTTGAYELNAKLVPSFQYTLSLATFSFALKCSLSDVPKKEKIYYLPVHTLKFVNGITI